MVESQTDIGVMPPGPGRLRMLLALAWRFYFARRPLIVLGMALYLVAIHLMALALFWLSTWPGVIAWKLGLGSRWVEFDYFFDQRRGQVRNRADAAEPGAILFIGDSLLATLDTGALTDRAVSLAIPGDTARRVAARLHDYHRLAEARLVFIHVGTNDLRFRTPAELERPFARILHTVPEAVPVILSGILPVDDRVFPYYGNAQVRAANEIMARLCRARPGCLWIQPGKELVDETGNLDPRYQDRHDGLHLNIEGNRIWRTSLQPHLTPWRSL